MSVRPRRERAAVDYSEAGQLENNGVQGWARSAGLSLKHLEEENKISKGGNGKKASPTDKENSAGKDKQLEVDKPGKKNTADKPGNINSTDASKTQKIASRGRFAGHTVVPIEDHKKNKSRAISKEKPGFLPPAAAAKSVPGLPGVLQKSHSRKASPECPSKRTSDSWDDDTDPVPQPSAFVKRAKAPAAAPLDSMTQMTQIPRTGPSPWFSAPPAAPSPPRSSRAEMLVEQLNAQLRDLQSKYRSVEAQYETLKKSKIDNEVQALLERHNVQVAELIEGAQELANHWKIEAEKRRAMEADGHELMQELQKKSAELLATQQALVDTQVSSVEKDNRITELTQRNTFLERWARKPCTVEKCIQTDNTGFMNVAVQAPSWQGAQVMQARAMAPEGVPGSQLYNPISMGEVVDASYSLVGQRTLAKPSVSDARFQNLSGQELYLAQARELHKSARRASMSGASAPLPMGQDSVRAGVAPPRMDKMTRMSLAPVVEEEPLRLPPRPPTQPESGMPLLTTPLGDGVCQYKHPRSGFVFLVGPALPQLDSVGVIESDAGSTEGQLVYRPIEFGMADSVLPDYLLDEIIFAEGQKENLVSNILSALAKLNRRQQI